MVMGNFTIHRLKCASFNVTQEYKDLSTPPDFHHPAKLFATKDP